MKHLKTILSLILISALMCSVGVTAFSAEGEEQQRLLGDADLNGVVDIADATAVQRYDAYFQLLAFKGENMGDVDRDGSTDIVDVSFLQRYLAGMRAPQGIEEPVAPQTMRFEEGSAQPFVKLEEESYWESYSNRGKSVLMFMVYVETDYDTDLDGKPDLIKTWVKLPRAAAEGDYKAPVIYEANPYSAGKSDSPSSSFAIEPLDEQQLKNTPAKRIPAGAASLEEVADRTVLSDWHYQYAEAAGIFYSNTGGYDYYLARGYAVVSTAGLGTNGSEGLELCGTAMEAEAFKSVIEWLHGDRTAYTDRDSNITTAADWSNGKVGMTGISYLGTMAYEVATTGVAGLETVVPLAGISSWYDYTNSQGLCNYDDNNYTAWLSGICSSRFFDGHDRDTDAYLYYTQWREYVRESALALDGDYGDFWAARDYSAADSIRVPALIVHGLNDYNVRTKQFDLMYRAFKSSGQPVKLLLHQNAHDTPGSRWSDIMIGDVTYCELINRWFSHYLAGVDNGIEELPEVTVQSNVDGRFVTYDSWETAASVIMNPDTEEDYTDVSDPTYYFQYDFLDPDSAGYDLSFCTGVPGIWKMDVTQPLTVQGAVEVNLRIKSYDLSERKTAFEVYLMDCSDVSFSTFDTRGRDTLPLDDIGQQAWTFDPTEPLTRIVQWRQTEVLRKQVAWGTMDLKNPNAGYLPDTAVTPEEPVKEGEWYTYHLYLQPNLYTVLPGHRLELYIFPSFKDETYVAPPVSFTVDNSQSYAVIPVAE